MRFTQSKGRPTPTIIIVALIDILIVLVIFLIVTQTFKQQPALKLALPESKQPQQGASESPPLTVTIDRKEPYLYVEQNPVTLEKLQETLKVSAARNADLQVSLRADKDAPFGKVVNVMDAAKAAGVKFVNAQTMNPSPR
jgi:biopolymer transport protein ExbD